MFPWSGFCACTNVFQLKNRKSSMLVPFWSQVLVWFLLFPTSFPFLHRSSYSFFLIYVSLCVATPLNGCCAHIGNFAVGWINILYLLWYGILSWFIPCPAGYEFAIVILVIPISVIRVSISLGPDPFCANQKKCTELYLLLVDGIVSFHDVYPETSIPLWFYRDTVLRLRSRLG